MNGTGKSMTTTLLVAALLGIAGCQSNVVGDNEGSRAIDAALAEADGSATMSPVPPPVVAALLPPIAPVTVPLVREEGPRFEIAVRDAPAREFFMGLVEGTDFNMVVHPDVVGGVTLDLKNVTIPAVMGIMRDVYGFEYRRTSYGFEVLPARLRSRIYQVNYLNMLRAGTSQMRVSSGQVTQAEGEAVVDDGTTTTSSTRAASVTGSEISTLNPETSFWTELRSSIEAILGDTTGRFVAVNPQSGTVVVRAMPDELREVESFLITSEAIASRQVILEAKILEVELSDEYRQGINWAAMISSGSRSLTVGQVGGGTIVDGGSSLIGAPINIGNLDPGNYNPIVGTAAKAFGGMFTVALALNNFTAFIELLDTQGTVHVLSSPRIATLNNQKAVIKVGSDEYFVTDISSTTTTGTTTTTTPSVELTPFFSGIALDVTPQISEEGGVILHVHPAISRVVDQDKTITVGNSTQTIPLALSTVRESDSVVHALSGQVIVIGGLMQTIARDDEARTPGLADLPGIGGLFEHTQETLSKSELVILLKPVVVDAPQQWAGLAAESAQRIGAINTYAISQSEGGTALSP